MDMAKANRLESLLQKLQASTKLTPRSGRHPLLELPSKLPCPLRDLTASALQQRWPDELQIESCRDRCAAGLPSLIDAPRSEVPTIATLILNLDVGR